MKVSFSPSLLLLLLCSAALCSAAENCHGTENQHALVTQEPKLVRQVENGKLLRIDGIEPAVFVAHVYGTAKQRGYAAGALLKEESIAIFKQFYAWAEQAIDTEIAPYVPKIFREPLEKFGLEVALDLQYELLKAHIPQHWNEEMQGVAEATGLSFMDVMRVQMVPELVKASCSIVGAWGNATAQAPSSPGSLYQLRALDWAINSPLQQYPVVFVHHPTDGGHEFSILGWPLFYGALTGLSSAPVGICEKVWLHYKGHDSRAGYPWNFLTRDILQFDRTVDDGLTRIVNARRTCSIFLGLGDTSASKVKIVEYAHDKVAIFDDQNFQVNNTAHPQLQDVVYVDKHTQPSGDPCLGSLLTDYHGKLTADTFLRQVTARLQTGNTHAAVYDYANMHFYLSNASPWVNGTAVAAYDRPWVRLDMGAEFARQM